MNMDYRKEAERNKKLYPPGTKVELIHMEDAQAVESGTKGVVNYVDDIGQVHVNWENGRTLALVPSVDSFRVVSKPQLEQER